MISSKKQFKTIDEYIKTFPRDVQKALEKMRQTIRKAAPEATESISYGMPAFNLHGKYLVYFAAWKSHIGFYPIPSGMEAFKKELLKYKNAKGSVQFPLSKPLPLALVTRIVKFRAKENLERHPLSEFPKISTPAERALTNAKIKTLKDLSKWNEKELLQLHGIGKSTIPILRKALKTKKLKFKK